MRGQDRTTDQRATRQQELLQTFLSQCAGNQQTAGWRLPALGKADQLLGISGDQSACSRAKALDVPGSDQGSNWTCCSWYSCALARMPSVKTTSASVPCSAAICRISSVIFIEQNFGPHIEQNLDNLAPSPGSVSS